MIADVAEIEMAHFDPKLVDLRPSASSGRSNPGCNLFGNLFRSWLGAWGSGILGR